MNEENRGSLDLLATKEQSPDLKNTSESALVRPAEQNRGAVLSGVDEICSTSVDGSGDKHKHEKDGGIISGTKVTVEADISASSSLFEKKSDFLGNLMQIVFFKFMSFYFNVSTSNMDRISIL